MTVARRPGERTSDATRKRVALRLRGTPSSVAKARHLIVGFAREHGFPESELFDIDLAVGEACANAVMHSVTARSTFRVEGSLRADDIVVTVSDSGDDMQPSMLPDPDRVGGLGLFLIRHLMDQLSLEMSSRGTRLTMSRRRRAA